MSTMDGFFGTFLYDGYIFYLSLKVFSLWSQIPQSRVMFSDVYLLYSNEKRWTKGSFIDWKTSHEGGLNFHLSRFIITDTECIKFRTKVLRR
jgi:hypothetical protein